MLRRLNVSDAAAKIATSSTPASRARARPVRFGTSAVYRTPAARVMPANTSAASAICGTHFGLTNAETSMTECPAAASRFDERDLLGASARAPARSAARRAGRPRRSVTRCGQRHRHSSSSKRHARLHQLARLGSAMALTRPVARRLDRQLHLHRFEHDQHIALRHLLTRLDVHRGDGRRHRRGQRHRRRPTASRRCPPPLPPSPRPRLPSTTIVPGRRGTPTRVRGSRRIGQALPRPVRDPIPAVAERA